MNKEVPNWERGDTLKSVYGVISMGKVAIVSLLDRADTWLADRCNGPEDED